MLGFKKLTFGVSAAEDLKTVSGLSGLKVNFPEFSHNFPRKVFIKLTFLTGTILVYFIQEYSDVISSHEQGRFQKKIRCLRNTGLHLL